MTSFMLTFSPSIDTLIPLIENIALLKIVSFLTQILLQIVSFSPLKAYLSYLCNYFHGMFWMNNFYILNFRHGYKWLISFMKLHIRILFTQDNKFKLKCKLCNLVNGLNVVLTVWNVKILLFYLIMYIYMHVCVFKFFCS